MLHRPTAAPSTLVAACLVLAACQDAPTAPADADVPAAVTATAPHAGQTDSIAPAAPVAGAMNADDARLEALRDALDRVVPALANDDRAAALGAGLRRTIAALERGERAPARDVLQSLEQTLARYTARDRAMSADVDVIRLAITAASAP